MTNNLTFTQTVLHNLIGNDSQWFWTMAQALVVFISLWFIGKQIRLQGLNNSLGSLEAFRGEWQSEKNEIFRGKVCEYYLAARKQHYKNYINHGFEENEALSQVAG